VRESREKAGLEMLTVDTVAKVRRAHFVDGKKIKRIVRELHLSRATVRGIVRAGPNGVIKRQYVRKSQPLPQLGSHVAALDKMLAANVTVSVRERLTYQRMHEELRLVGYTGGYDAVRRYGRGWAEREGVRTAEAFVPLSFAAGEAYQFDWSHEIVVLDGVTVPIKLAQMRLCHSRMLFVRAYMRETQEMVFDAHEKAFAFFKGVPTRGIYDNMKTAVETVFVGKERKFNRRFEQLMSQHLIEPPVGDADKDLRRVRRQPAGRKAKSRTRLVSCVAGSSRRARRSRRWTTSTTGCSTSASAMPRRSRIPTSKTKWSSRYSRPSAPC
jgi:transposase